MRLAGDSGSADSLSERLNQHRKSIDFVRGLHADDFLVVPFRTKGKGHALMAEQVSALAFRPVWNASSFRGFGCKDPGRTRAIHQKTSAWDLLHPGRPWVGQTVTQSDPELRDAVRAYLGEQVALPAWGVKPHVVHHDSQLVPLGETNSTYRFILSGSELAVVTAAFQRPAGSL